MEVLLYLLYITVRQSNTLTIIKGGQITGQLKLKEFNLGCSYSEYRTQLNDKGSMLKFCQL